MAQKLTINQPRASRAARTSRVERTNRLPGAVAILIGAVAVLAFSFAYVARISPKHGDVSGIVQQIRKERPAGATALPSRVAPTHGTKFWMKKGGNS